MCFRSGYVGALPSRDKGEGNRWPQPEVPNPQIIDMTTGMLGLMDQENQIAAFMQTLTDA
jgi:hypothetical protein